MTRTNPNNNTSAPATTNQPQRASGAMEQRQPDGVTTVSQRFLADVERQFAAQMGAGPQFSAFERQLTQHMYLRIDAALKMAEAKRKRGSEYSWRTIDRQQLALDTVHCVHLGLDPLIDNHVHPVFYWNSHKGVYDVVLQRGYVGADFIARQYALDPPIDIVYQLVYDTDVFRPLPRSVERDVENYVFEIDQPFDRGNIIGGFGYLVYDDPRKNRLVLVTQRDFGRSKAASKSDFWRDNPVEMHYKTVVHRVAEKVVLDPRKVNAAALAAIQPDETRNGDANFEVEVATRANRELVDTEPTPATNDEHASNPSAPGDQSRGDAEQEQGDPPAEPADADTPQASTSESDEAATTGKTKQGTLTEEAPF